jgi:molybdopterin-guanine dinucleotide biosynthesis protein B
VLLLGRQRWALMHELRGAPEPELDELLGHMQACDLVLVEGFKGGAFPKLEVWRAEPGREPLAGDWPGIIGIASDGPLPDGVPQGLEQLELADIGSIADFALRHATRR